MLINTMLSRTQNGAITYNTTGSGIVDMYFRLIDGVEDETRNLLIESAWREDQRGSVVLLYDLRNCRGGKGRHNLFVLSLAKLITSKAIDHTTLKSWFGLLPHYGSFKDYWRLADALRQCDGCQYIDFIIDLYADALLEDCATAFELTPENYRNSV